MTLHAGDADVDIGQRPVLVGQGRLDHLVQQVRGLAIDATHPLVDTERRYQVTEALLTQGRAVLLAESGMGLQKLAGGLACRQVLPSSSISCRMEARVFSSSCSNWARYRSKRAGSWPRSRMFFHSCTCFLKRT